MGSILHITSQLNTERTHLHPQAVFYKINRGEPVPLGEEGERRWAVPQAITIVEEDEDHDEYPHGPRRHGMAPRPRHRRLR